MLVVPKAEENNKVPFEIFPNVCAFVRGLQKMIQGQDKGDKNKMIIAISFILGLGLWLYGLKTAFVTGIDIDAIFFLLLGGQLVKIWYAYISDQNFDEWKKHIEEMLDKR